ncbi:hypothetical protein A2U01_0018266, partial [Trifolium medium]|nr:hypothetical protein [Trifolium medium]
QLNSAREVIFHVLAVISTDQARKFVMYGRATGHDLVWKGVRSLSALAAWNSPVSVGKSTKEDKWVKLVLGKFPAMVLLLGAIWFGYGCFLLLVSLSHRPLVTPPGEMVMVMVH